MAATGSDSVGEPVETAPKSSLEDVSDSDPENNGGKVQMKRQIGLAGGIAMIVGSMIGNKVIKTWT